MTAGAGALALTPEWLRACQQSGGKLIQRAIPSSANHTALKEVLKTQIENGGRFLDTVHGNSPTEEVSATIATELGVHDKIFWSSRASPAGPPQPGPAAAAATAQMERDRLLHRQSGRRADDPAARPGAEDQCEAHAAIRPKLDGGKWTAEAVWTNPQTPMFMSSPVIIGGSLYGLTTRSLGQFVAIDAASGKTLWNTKGREGENASMLGSPSWLLASTTNGTLVVARASRPHRQLDHRQGRRQGDLLELLITGERLGALRT